MYEEIVVAVNSKQDAYTIGPTYGTMYTNDTIAVELTTKELWYELGGVQPWIEGSTSNCTFSDPGIIVLEAGDYQISYNLSTDFSANPGAKQELEYGIFIDGSIQDDGRAERTLANSTDVGACSGVAIITLADNAVVSLAAMNETSSGKTIHVEHGNLVVRRLVDLLP